MPDAEPPHCESACKAWDSRAGKRKRGRIPLCSQGPKCQNRTRALTGSAARIERRIVDAREFGCLRLRHRKGRLAQAQCLSPQKTIEKECETVYSAGSRRIQNGPSQENEIRTERQSPEHIFAASDAAVEQKRILGTDSAPYFGQRMQCRFRRVKLTSPMIRNANRVDPESLILVVSSSETTPFTIKRPFHNSLRQNPVEARLPRPGLRQRPALMRERRLARTQNLQNRRSRDIQTPADPLDRTTRTELSPPNIPYPARTEHPHLTLPNHRKII